MPIYHCKRASAPVKIDGVLNDEAWAQAEPVRLKTHNDSGFSRFETLVRLCYDDSFLYVGFDCPDTQIKAELLQRDDPIFDEEVVEIFIDPDSDQFAYYEFEVSPRNTIYDAYVENPTGMKCELDPSWDCDGLRTAVRIDEATQNWSVEMAIPFSELKSAPNTPPKQGDHWRMNLYRIERAPVVEYACWSPTLAEPANFHVPARFGILEFA